MSLYADTSFLFSYYASDANSSRADAWRQVHPEPLPLLTLHRLELHNAFELAVFQKRISAREAGELWSQVETDLAAGLLVTPTISLTDLFHHSEGMVQHHTAQTGARSLDILHVAAAQLLAVDERVTFDLRQAALAHRLGMRVAVL